MIPFACDMTALSSEQRARYQELAIQLRAVLREVCELSDGYEFEFPGHDNLRSAGGNNPARHGCCPFFAINIRLDPEERLFWRLAGAEGIKAELRIGFRNKCWGLWGPLGHSQPSPPCSRPAIIRASYENTKTSSHRSLVCQL
jgi:hypothetical protein